VTHLPSKAPATQRTFCIEVSRRPQSGGPEGLWGKPMPDPGVFACAHPGCRGPGDRCLSHNQVVRRLAWHECV
jgi:hypothetical protein